MIYVMGQRKYLESNECIYDIKYSWNFCEKYCVANYSLTSYEILRMASPEFLAEAALLTFFT